MLNIISDVIDALGKYNAEPHQEPEETEVFDKMEKVILELDKEIKNASDNGLGEAQNPFIARTE